MLRIGGSGAGRRPRRGTKTTPTSFSTPDPIVPGTVPTDGLLLTPPRTWASRLRWDPDVTLFDHHPPQRGRLVGGGVYVAAGEVDDVTRGHAHPAREGGV